jgi:hypothetical protein
MNSTRNACYMNEQLSTSFENDSPETIVDRHGCLSWHSSSAQRLDHHDMDVQYVNRHFEAERTLFLWQYVSGAIEAYEEGMLTTFVADGGRLSTYDQGNLSTRRWFAEELGFYVSDFSVNMNGFTSSALVRARSHAEMPVASDESPERMYSQDEIDRWYSGQFVGEFDNRVRTASLSELFRASAADAATSGRIEVRVGLSQNVRGQLSFIRRCLALSGCNISSFVRDTSTSADFSYVADVSVVDPALKFV